MSFFSSVLHKSDEFVIQKLNEDLLNLSVSTQDSLKYLEFIGFIGSLIALFTVYKDIHLIDLQRPVIKLFGSVQQAGSRIHEKYLVWKNCFPGILQWNDLLLLRCLFHSKGDEVLQTDYALTLLPISIPAEYTII